jgi:type IV secretory pathway VirB4 component
VESLGVAQRGGDFNFDPFAAYGAGLVSSPNVLVAGAIGAGKSTVVKMLLARSRRRGARAVVLDPKGEYRDLARACRGTVIDFEPGAPTWLSPFGGESDRDLATCESILAVVLERALGEEERFVLAREWAQLKANDRERPLRALSERLAMTLGQRRGSPARSIAIALRRLVDGDLAGLVDSPHEAPELAELVVLDLSRTWGTDRFALCALAATIAARRVVDAPEIAGYLVIDEAWAVLADEATARWLQGSWKLARARATSHLLVLHRWSDAFSAAPEGSAQRARVVGLLRDCDTAVLLRQDHGELDLLRGAIGLTDAERARLTGLERGVALVRFGRHRSIVRFEPDEFDRSVIDTDQAMRAFA